MSFTRTNKSIRISKICYLQQRKPLKSLSMVESSQPSLAHLSSIIQSERKKVINEEMQGFSLRLSETASQLKRQVKSMGQKRISSKEEGSLVLPRDIHTCYSFKIKKLGPSDGFFLSDITDESCKAVAPGHQESHEKEDVKTKRKNYFMRKMEFKTFLKNQQAKFEPSPRPTVQIKEVCYEKQILNSWSKDQLLLKTAQNQPKTVRNRRAKHFHPKSIDQS